MEEQQAPSAAAPTPAPKSKALWIVIAVVVVVVVVLLAAVLGGLFAGPAGEDRILKIGTVLSITGGLAAFGTRNQLAVIMAVEEINNQGGVLGQPIQLFHQNDDTKPTPARTAATTLISQNRVDAIVGATGSGQCAAVVPVARDNNVFEVSGSCTSVIFANLTLTGGWWARTAPPDLYQSVVAASYVATNESLTRAAVIGINNPYGVGLAQLFADNFERFGGTITTNSPVIITEVQFGATDYTTDLESALDVTPAPEIVYVVAYPPDGILLMKNFESGKATHPGWANVRLLFSEGVFEQAAFLDVLRNPPNNFDISGYEGTAPSAYGGVTGPEYDDWLDLYRARWGVDAFLFDDNNYDAAYLIALAAQKGGVATGQAIKDNIFAIANPPGTQIFPGEWAKALQEIQAGRDIDYEGASGSVNINEFGDALSGYVIWGVNATGRAVNLQIFPEGLVVDLLGAPPLTAAMAPLREAPPIWSPEARVKEA
jgi:neutral amino acid transport system substrate-binding protein